MTFNPMLCEECQARLITEEQERLASLKTVDEVLKEGLAELIDLARQNDLSEDDIDSVLDAIIDDRADERRRCFKIH